RILFRIFHFYILAQESSHRQSMDAWWDLRKRTGQPWSRARPSELHVSKDRCEVTGVAGDEALVPAGERADEDIGERAAWQGVGSSPVDETVPGLVGLLSVCPGPVLPEVDAHSMEELVL